MPDRVGTLMAIVVVAAALYVWFRLCEFTIDQFIEARRAKPDRGPANRREEKESSGSGCSF